MTAENYKWVIGFFNKYAFRRSFILFVVKYFPIINVITYVGAIILLFFFDKSKLVRFVAVPAITFLVVTIFRAAVNAKRPYDELDFTPLIEVKHGKGKSFPSRHTASAVIIAIACLYVNVGFGIIMLIISAMIGVSRVCVGAHYPKDVFVGAVTAVAFGIGFFI